MALMEWADVCCRKTLNWHKLSNSGDLLKILIPNYTRKNISGWINYSCKVTSQNMIEREMDNRGSKSANIAVKEQRVDGSWHRLRRCLRCTLMGFERNYQVKILTNQLLRRLYFTLSNIQKLQGFQMQNLHL